MKLQQDTKLVGDRVNSQRFNNANVSTLIPLAEAAAYLCITPQTLYGWVHQRRVPYRKHGRKLVFCRRELEAWSDAHKITPFNDYSFDLCRNNGNPALGHTQAGSLKIERNASRSSRKENRDGS